jgi:site-specific DNA recombinase
MVMKIAAIYARVSSDQQKEDKTINSQTAAVMAFASTQGYSVPAEWIFEDEGFSGATLVRPGLERVRDLVAEGQIEAVLVLSPDRLSRKYAYQVLLTEEWLRHGVQTIFVKAPQSQTPEDQLLLQFQGMIAEYERAQILERSRRGKRHRAKLGEVSVLSGAPYGYRYMRKTEDRAAYYEVIETQAEVVRLVFELYTAQALSIGAITRRLNELGLPTRREQTCWERSTIWAMLRNPAYRGMACFGKTQEAARQHRDNRAARMRGHPSRRSPRPMQEAPREQWIQIPVPALVDERTFDLAQEQLQDNKKFSPRRTVEPSVLQGLVHCADCGYALYRTVTRSSARKIYYYRCLGSDAWRYQGQARCSAKPIRLDLLEDTVWTEVTRLLEDPALIQVELTRRLEAARTSDPVKQNQDRIVREMLQTQRRVERLLTAYQEDLLSLDELRRRMPELRQRETRLKAELDSLNAQLADQATYLRLAHTLGEFLERLRTQSQGLGVLERQRVVRLLVKEVIVGDDSITIRHSIPTSSRPSGGPAGSLNSRTTAADASGSRQDSLLCTWRAVTVAGQRVA